MRLTVNLEPDLYALAASLANNFLVSRGREPVTAKTVARAEAQEDIA